MGVAFMVLVLGAGAAVDYTGAATARSKIQNAADAAALAAARDFYLPNAGDPLARARRVFDENFKGFGEQAVITSFQVVKEARSLQVTVSADYPTSIMGVINKTTLPISTFSEVIWGQQDSEVALVLDNTGSMADDMPALRQASRDFTDILFSYGASTTRMSLVPYVASVNVGPSNMPLSMMDTSASSRWHGQAFKNQSIGTLLNCNPTPYTLPTSPSTGSGSSTTAGPPPPPEPGPRNDDRRASLQRLWKSLAAVSSELFGIKSVHAQVTPETRSGYGGSYEGPGAPYVPNNQQGFVPTGFRFAHPCELQNPSKVSHFDLFNRLPGARWKGCVEARPEPYDITEEVPRAGDPNTLFVPYFWPDEPGRRSDGTTSYINNYLDDTPLPQGRYELITNIPYDPATGLDITDPSLVTSTTPTRQVRSWVNVPEGWRLGDDWQKHANLFKYNGINSPLIVDKTANTFGPNAGCPDELVRLTSDRSRLTNQINGLIHWSRGGTIISEGVMWGWRTLSPNPPFADGKPYRGSKKFMVIMTDGVNSLQENNKYGPTKTDYTAYGYLGIGHFASDRYTDAESYLNQRTRLACENAKNAGIQIYTVVYREESASAKQLMQECASTSTLAFYAGNQQELKNVFAGIAFDIIKLRLKR